eukprot:scaffold5681_cov377-Prasinococcus_capsulatus_cf.AAC.3
MVTKIVMPTSVHICFTEEMTLWAAVESRPEVGSSRKNRRGAATSSQPIDKRRFCPPLSPRKNTPPTSVFLCAFRPSTSMAPYTSSYGVSANSYGLRGNKGRKTKGALHHAQSKVDTSVRAWTTSWSVE